MPRKEYNFHYIYKTTNRLNGKYYVGMHSTNNINDGYIGSGDRLRKSIRKYGKENFKFEIVEYLPNRSSLKDREREMITEDLLNDKMCMNLCLGGSGGYISPEGVKKGRESTDKVLREKYGDDFKSQISNGYWDRVKLDQKLLEKHKDSLKNGLKLSNFDHGSTFRDKKHSDETKKIIGEKNSINQKGEKNSQFGTCWITNGEKSLKIKKEELSLYPEWKKGRKIMKQQKTE
jgi:group I intron endonuclease